MGHDPGVIGEVHYTRPKSCINSGFGVASGHVGFCHTMIILDWQAGHLSALPSRETQ